MILLPAKDPQYASKWYDIHGNEHVSTVRPLELVKEACLQQGASYNGLVESVRYNFGYQKKVPLMIKPQKHFFCFPTRSPEDAECIWIFPHHVHSQHKYHEGTMVKFSNGQYMQVPIAINIMTRQSERAFNCAYRDVSSIISFLVEWTKVPHKK